MIIIEKKKIIKYIFYSVIIRTLKKETTWAGDEKKIIWRNENFEQTTHVYM